MIISPGYHVFIPTISRHTVNYARGSHNSIGRETNWVKCVMYIGVLFVDIVTYLKLHPLLVLSKIIEWFRLVGCTTLNTQIQYSVSLICPCIREIFFNSITQMRILNNHCWPNLPAQNWKIRMAYMRLDVYWITLAIHLLTRERRNFHRNMRTFIWIDSSNLP